MATIFHTLFDYGQARLLTDLPTEVRSTLSMMEKRRGVL
jgi:hypothetical protein